MKRFTLDAQLEKECFLLVENEQFMLLLMDNALIPWFIVVPKTDKTEWHELTHSMQLQIGGVVNQLSEFISDEFKPDTLNTATIGNIVKQMHIHIVARYCNDCYWPGVVWGGTQKQPYPLEEVNKISTKITSLYQSPYVKAINK